MGMHYGESGREFQIFPHHSPHQSPSKSWPPPYRGVHRLYRRDRCIVLNSTTASTHGERPSFFGESRLKVRQEPRASPWILLRSRSPCCPRNSRTQILSSLSAHVPNLVLHSPSSIADRSRELSKGSVESLVDFR
ncbi:hypothetical protein V6N11_051911 [Hibiscus sabdariffa]|uniref:Uncharacterized protein n=1 Tax=Hibiscus sabdariffa TaxID=183260 RepID=A0ABR2U8E8_9ROSI